jgi:hypothetical protein
VLLGELNIRDKDEFARFADRLGYTVTELEMNRVKYLRTEEGDLPMSCEAVIRDLYAMPPALELHLIPEGFTWPETAA